MSKVYPHSIYPPVRFGASTMQWWTNEGKLESPNTIYIDDTETTPTRLVHDIDVETLRHANQGHWSRTLILFQHIYDVGDRTLTHKYMSMVGGNQLEQTQVHEGATRISVQAL